jgi:hypothetical protein
MVLLQLARVLQVIAFELIFQQRYVSQGIELGAAHLRRFAFAMKDQRLVNILLNL